MIKDDKTEFFLIGTRKKLAKIDTAYSITVGEYDIDPNLCVRNLDVWFYSQLNMSESILCYQLLGMVKYILVCFSNQF